MLFFLLSSAYADDLPKKELKVFTAAVSDVRLQGTLQEQGKKLDDIISVKVPAIIFNKPIKITDVRKAKRYQVPEIDILISYLKANIDGSAQDMAAFWAPSEQKEMLEDMSNPEMFKKNRSYRQEYPGLTILGIIYQDKTMSVLTRETDPNPILPAIGITMIRIDGKLYLTNHPNNDLELAIIEASFK
jgi:hypothetical protein